MFSVLCYYLQARKIQEAKEYVSSFPELIHKRDSCDDGIVWHLCVFGPDDADLLHYFVNKGASPENKSKRSADIPFICALDFGKPNLVRAFLDLGTRMDMCVKITTTHETTALGYLLFSPISDGRRACIRVLIDAGAQTTNINDLPDWVKQFVADRNKARNAAITLIGVTKCCGSVSSKMLCGNGRDVFRIIARCVWSMRGHK